MKYNERNQTHKIAEALNQNIHLLTLLLFCCSLQLYQTKKCSFFSLYLIYTTPYKQKASLLHLSYLISQLTSFYKQLELSGKLLQL